MERLTQKPFVDKKRIDEIRCILKNAYCRQDNEAIKKAALMAQQYVDEGGDDYKELPDDLEDYNGCAGNMLADQYILRLMRDRHCDNDDDQEYIRTGLKREMVIKHTIRCCGKEFTAKEWSDYCTESYKDPSKRIVTSIGKYDFNEHDICLNPTVMSLVVSHGGYGYEVTLKWCDCGNGLWSYGLSYNCGTGGGGFGCSFADVTDDPKSYRYGYRSEKECIIACCDAAISRIESSGHENEAKTKKLIEMVKDYKKSIGRPAPVQLSLFDF